MSHKIYLLKYPAPLRQRSHFAIWAPSAEDSSIGKIIQVLGTPFTGFSLDIQQGYHISKALPKPVVIELGVFNCQIVTETHVGQLPDTTARDKLESVARSVAPPGPSRNPFVVFGVFSMTPRANRVRYEADILTLERE